ncbi:hypothetical protein ABTZ57_01395 [Streptomyces sp. NPDC094048]|uniref:hypothetical protein n=1 Tax=unclassified Streptomyces TaxID=2593676 RepID=UPI0033344629
MSADSTPSNEQRLGSLIDALDITTSLAEDELAAGAIVLLKVIETDGSTRLSASYSDGLGWIERVGMLRIAEAMETGAAHTREPDD